MGGVSPGSRLRAGGPSQSQAEMHQMLVGAANNLEPGASSAENISYVFQINNMIYLFRINQYRQLIKFYIRQN